MPQVKREWFCAPYVGWHLCGLMLHLWSPLHSLGTFLAPLVYLLMPWKTNECYLKAYSLIDFAITLPDGVDIIGAASLLRGDWKRYFFHALVWLYSTRSSWVCISWRAAGTSTWKGGQRRTDAAGRWCKRSWSSTHKFLYQLLPSWGLEIENNELILCQNRECERCGRRLRST